MLKILQARLQQYMNQELPDVQAGFRKGRGTRDQIANICWIIKKGRVFQKNIYICFIDYAKAFDFVDHSKLWKILQEMGIPDHLTCLLRNPYAGQEATVRTRCGTTDRFQIGKGVRQGCILSPCLFNLYAEHVMQSARLDESQAGIKIARNSITSDMQIHRTSLVAQTVKRLPTMQETWVQSLGWEDLLEEAWQPTIVFLPGQRSLVGYSPWGCKELDMTERLSTAQLFCTGIVD